MLSAPNLNFIIEITSIAVIVEDNIKHWIKCKKQKVYVC